MRQPLGQTKVQNAFRVLCLERDFVVIVPFFVVTGQLCEKARGWQLSFVANNNHLVASRDGAKSVDRLDLRRLVHYEEIERNRARLEKLRYRERTHEKDRLDLLNDGCGTLQKLPYGKVISLFCDLSVQDAERTDTTPIPRQSGGVRRCDLVPREPHAFHIQLTEAFYETPVSLAIAPFQFRMLRKDDGTHGFEVRPFE